MSKHFQTYLLLFNKRAYILLQGAFCIEKKLLLGLVQC